MLMKETSDKRKPRSQQVLFRHKTARSAHSAFSTEVRERDGGVDGRVGEAAYSHAKYSLNRLSASCGFILNRMALKRKKPPHRN